MKTLNKMQKKWQKPLEKWAKAEQNSDGSLANKEGKNLQGSQKRLTKAQKSIEMHSKLKQGENSWLYWQLEESLELEVLAIKWLLQNKHINL